MEASLPQPFSTWGSLRGSRLAGDPHPVPDLGVGVSHGQRHPGGQDAGSGSDVNSGTSGSGSAPRRCALVVSEACTPQKPRDGGRFPVSDG